MKTIIALLLVAPLSSFAGNVSAEDLRQALLRDQGTFAGENCSMNVQLLAGGLAVKAKSAGGEAEFLVKDSDMVALAERSMSDGSYERSYEVPGVGKLRVLYADDSFAELELSTGDRVVKCEVDF